MENICTERTLLPLEDIFVHHCIVDPTPPKYKGDAILIARIRVSGTRSSKNVFPSRVAITYNSGESEQKVEACM